MARDDNATAVPVIAAETRAAIADVLALYCHAIDRRRWTLMGDCFHDDATLSFGAFDGAWPNFVVAARGLIDPLPVTHHQLGQTLYAAEERAVRTESYFTAIHRVPADAPPGVFGGRGQEYHAVVGGRYVDRFTQRGGLWRIARRVSRWTGGTTCRRSPNPRVPSATDERRAGRAAPDACRRRRRIADADHRRNAEPACVFWR